MKTPRLLIILLTMHLLQACSLPVSSPQPGKRDVSLENLANIKTPDILFRGRITIGPKSSSFSPCGSRQQYLLHLTPAMQRTLMTMAKTPYQEIYGEVFGHLAIPSLTGYNADFQAMLVTKQLNYATPDSLKSCSQAYQPTQASGIKPVWSVMLSGQKVIATLPGQTNQQWHLQQIQTQADRRLYLTSQGQLSLTPETCRPDKSQVYGWTATLTHNKQRRYGCARLSNIDASRSWVGTYFASSTKSNNFSVTLHLYPDHSARTLYTYTNDPAPLIETGFWQALNDHQVQVVMTQHQQQYLLSQRIFSRDGDKLHTQKEQVGAQIYQINNGGLTLYREKK
ncbi:hypothetical protein VA7868_02641 [Vibrio aerogenes CECT 7868]|uniref:Lipoprotein n=1 Tax=Vibrio aerogenes CECT 7868 TaxID=1216006 RepID=A0A1M5ZEZ7_9VIBR|nr:hypothetical protein [Vibrio aerogenes]SHI22731.1 hypothetical protein VA7868_02641 [Vibrio aerogenes CECT 7868]